jgi:hypothetical protein
LPIPTPIQENLIELSLLPQPHLCNFLQEFFTLEMLNDRIPNRRYSYGFQKRTFGECSCIHAAHVFQMTASEMHCFVILLPIMIGDLIPKDNKIWIFFIFSKIVAIVTSYSITDEQTAG